MKLSWRHSVGIKLSGILAVVILLALCPMFYLVSVSVSNFGTYSVTVNEEQIHQQAVAFLSRLSRERGEKYEEYFTRVQSAVGLLATAGSALYRRSNEANIGDLPAAQFELQKENGMFLTPPEEPVMSAYWGGGHLSPAVRREVGLLSLLDPLMKKTKALLADSQAVHIITTSGIGRYFCWDEKSKEAARHLPQISAFDLRDGAPMTIFTQGKRDRSQTQWTPIYRDDVIDGLMLTATGAMLDDKDQLKGIVGVDLPLRTIVEDVLLNSDISSLYGGQILFAFLVDSTGRLIAFPDKFLSYFGFDYDPSVMHHSDDVLKFSLSQSAEAGMRKICPQLLKADNLVQLVEINGEKHLIASQTLATLGWKFALVTRESDMISSVKRTQNALQGTLFKLRKEFLVTSIVTVFLALIFVFLAIRHFVGPLKTLSRIAQKVGEGDLTVHVDLKRADEIGALGSAMNKMIHRLSMAEKLRTDYSRLLEEEIRMRTRDLEEKNRQLEKAVSDLNSESSARKMATEALIESEKQLRSIMSSSLAGLCIVQNGRFRYVNTAMEEIFGYTREQLIRHQTPGDIVLKEYKNDVLKRLERREQGEYFRPVRSYQIKCRRQDGTIIDVLVAGAGITWEGKVASVGTIVDISLLKKAEEKLKINERRLQNSLEEKNVLLREVYHRTKNNMLVIISLLGLQKDVSQDSTVQTVFTEMENRIRTMALVHENLYQTKNLSELQLGHYVEELIRGLVDSMTIADKVEVLTEFEPLSVSFDQAVPIGLIVNELVTNSIKHAFPQSGSGVIFFRLRQQKGEVELVLGDDGIGLPAEIDVRKSRSFGLQIASSMIEKQLGGTFEVECHNGTTFRIRFTARSLTEE